jgi:hypothetical protein
MAATSERDPSSSARRADARDEAETVRDGGRAPVARSLVARMPRWLKRSLQATAGVVVALVASECAFRVRDHGAFPHLNVYVPDGKLGVRLRPGATEKVSFNGNPVTDVRINTLGFRGGEWPPAPEALARSPLASSLMSPEDLARDEILVVGDSQVFGLGVQENETFSARLAVALGGKTSVLNAGVPTYGPMEYDAVVEEQLAARHARTVVYVVNFANDLFEAARPNLERHAVWDGWAVRKETAPESVSWFPGRTFLYRDSHAMYALRGFLHRNDPKVDDRSFSSEGSWQDLVTASKGEGQDGASLDLDGAKWQADLRKARADAIAAQQQLENAAKKAYPKLFQSQLGAEYLRTHGNPGDIVVVQKHISHGEASEPVETTAQSLVEGAKVRAQIEASLKKLAQKDKVQGKSVLDSFEARQAMEKQLAAIEAKQLAAFHATSPMRPALERVKAACALHGARLVVVALPLDVQVSSEEWKKYGHAPIDMTPTKVLVRDLLDLSTLMGLESFDATPALTAAEPGAFLFGDIHMTPKGHQAVATSLAELLRKTTPAPVVDVLPAGRSAPPSLAEWTSAPKLKIVDAPKGCVGQGVREWVRVVCRKASGGKIAPTSLAIADGGHGEASVLRFGDLASFVAPLLGQDVLLADFAWDRSKRRLRVTRNANGAIAMKFGKPEKLPAALTTTTEGAELMCACSLAVTKDASCASAIGAPDADCTRTYQGDCPRLLSCAQGDRSVAPKCLDGWLNAGAANHCYRACSTSSPCTVGKCTDWQGKKVCM